MFVPPAEYGAASEPAALARAGVAVAEEEESGGGGGVPLLSLSACSHRCISPSSSARRAHSARSSSALIARSASSSGQPSSAAATRVACSRRTSGSIDRNHRSMRFWNSRMPSSHASASSARGGVRRSSVPGGMEAAAAPAKVSSSVPAGMTHDSSTASQDRSESLAPSVSLDVSDSLLKTIVEASNTSGMKGR